MVTKVPEGQHIYVQAPVPVFEQSTSYQHLITQVGLLVESVRYLHYRLDEAEAHIAWLYKNNNIDKPWKRRGN